MEAFKSKGPRMIYLTRLRQRVKFDKGGMFHTDDPDLIKALNNHRNVIPVSKDGDGDGVITSKEEVGPGTPPEPTTMTAPEVAEALEEEASGNGDADDNDESSDEEEEEASDEVPSEETVGPVIATEHTRPELDGMAKDLGLDPEAYGNKQAVATAINAARGL